MEKTGNAAAPSTKRGRRPRTAWIKEVCSLRDSGLSPEEYAAKKGMVLSTLKFWMRVLRNEVEARTKCWLSRSLVIHRRWHRGVGQRWFT
jgi:hypothetical protein